MSKKIFLLIISVICLNAGFLRNDNIEVVIDSKTGLIWSDKAQDSTTRTWKDSITYCEDLEISFYKDWRMPNYNELYSLVDLDKVETKIDDSFVNKTQEKYWTSTTHVFYSSSVWAISFANGNDNSLSIQENTFYTRCVHDN